MKSPLLLFSKISGISLLNQLLAIYLFIHPPWPVFSIRMSQHSTHTPWVISNTTLKRYITSGAYMHTLISGIDKICILINWIMSCHCCLCCSIVVTALLTWEIVTVSAILSMTRETSCTEIEVYICYNPPKEKAWQVYDIVMVLNRNGLHRYPQNHCNHFPLFASILWWCESFTF